jgi:hypothetical protein
VQNQSVCARLASMFAKMRDIIGIFIYLIVGFQKGQNLTLISNLLKRFRKARKTKTKTEIQILTERTSSNRIAFTLLLSLLRGGLRAIFISYITLAQQGIRTTLGLRVNRICKVAQEGWKYRF